MFQRHLHGRAAYKRALNRGRVLAWIIMTTPFLLFPLLLLLGGCAHAPAARLAAEARADAQAAQTNLRTGAQRIQRGQMDAAWHSLVAADRQIGNAIAHLRELEERK